MCRFFRFGLACLWYSYQLTSLVIVWYSGSLPQLCANLEVAWLIIRQCSRCQAPSNPIRSDPSSVISVDRLGYWRFAVIFPLYTVRSPCLSYSITSWSSGAAKTCHDSQEWSYLSMGLRKSVTSVVNNQIVHQNFGWFDLIWARQPNKTCSCKFDRQINQNVVQLSKIWCLFEGVVMSNVVVL